MITPRHRSHKPNAAISRVVGRSLARSSSPSSPSTRRNTLRFVNNLSRSIAGVDRPNERVILTKLAPAVGFHFAGSPRTYRRTGETTLRTSRMCAIEEDISRPVSIRAKRRRRSRDRSRRRRKARAGATARERRRGGGKVRAGEKEKERQRDTWANRTNS